MLEKLAKFRPFQSRRIVPGLRQAIQANDNLPGFRRPAGPRGIRSQALVCRWSLIDGGTRLGCRWQPETVAPTALEDPESDRISNHSTRRKRADLSSLNPDP